MNKRPHPQNCPFRPDAPNVADHARHPQRRDGYANATLRALANRP